MDYLEKADVHRDASWTAFLAATSGRRRILLSTRATLPYADFQFAIDDIFIMGRESAGVPQTVHDAADARLLIPMRPGLRSLNVAVACAVVTAEAMRQLELFHR